MEIIYDREVDALNVSLRAGVVAKTLEIAPEILVDVDKKIRSISRLSARARKSAKRTLAE
ncbi:MAG: DUF2283 domain-containing protein [bacterium]|nr:DUF2283 domain-containing protein [bacterium]